ncbi:MAG: hypothetical protein WA655_17465 [Candidatus Korobacteraceae bacterium]
MKRNMFGVVSLFAVAMAFAVPALQAQSRVVANIGFDFYLQQKSMAAGEYEVSSISQQVDLMRNVNTDSGSFLLKSIHVQGAHGQHARLVFNKYGNQYFLSQIWDGNGDIGIQLSKSKREKELSLAQNAFPSGPEVVIVAMK